MGHQTLDKMKTEHIDWFICMARDVFLFSFYISQIQYFCLLDKPLKLRGVLCNAESEFSHFIIKYLCEIENEFKNTWGPIGFES